MWKARPVIGTPVGGIALQIQDGKDGFLADTAEQCADAIVRLVREKTLARRIGRAARESVRDRFLMPRLLRDELRLYGVAARLAQDGSYEADGGLERAANEKEAAA
jgi:trehalose synthase